MIRPAVHEREFEIARAVVIDARDSDASLVVEQLRHALRQKRYRQHEQNTERQRDRNARDTMKREW